MIGVDEMGRIVETLWMGGDVIRVSVMQFGVMTCTDETCWIGTVGTLQVMIGIGTGAESFAILGAFFVVTSSVSLDSQKKENSEDDVVCGGVETFEGEATLFMSLTSGFQKKDSSEMSFVRGDTGEETTFLGGAIQRVWTC